MTRWVLLALLTLPFASSAVVKIAVAKVLAADEAASGPITGTVTFTTIDATSTRVEVDVTGLAPHSTHGFHAHQYGDLRELTTFGTVGLHFMPLCSNRRRLQTPTASPTAAPFQAPSNPGGNTCLKDQVHGYPPSEYRQPGDMGNITADAAGNVQTTLIIGQVRAREVLALRLLPCRHLLFAKLTLAVAYV
jgi:Cu/Zn superoxide dismutase